MNIDVVISGWEQACCGGAFAVGERDAWSLHEVAPDSLPPDAPRTFFEEHHGQTPDDVPQWKVEGVVTGITGVSYGSTKVPGTDVLTRDDATPWVTEIQMVPARGEGLDAGEYRVGLEVDDDVALPGYVLSSQLREQLEKTKREAQLGHLRSGDAVGLALRRIADDASARFGTVAEIVDRSDGFALAITPDRSDSVSVVVTRSSGEESDGISVQLGEGRWQLDATADGVESARQLLDAAAAGRVVDNPQPPESPDRIDTVATAESGRSYTSSKPLRIMQLGNGVTMMAGRARELLARGEHHYAPWSSDVS